MDDKVRTMVNFTVGNTVGVKLTELAVEQLKRKHDFRDHILKEEGYPGLKEFELCTDRKGYTRFRMGDFMATFGPLLSDDYYEEMAKKLFASPIMLYGAEVVTVLDLREDQD